MRLPSPIVAGSIAIGVFAGGFAVGHFATEDSGSTTKAAAKPQVLGQVFGTNPNESSTSTTAVTLAPVTPPAPQAPQAASTPSAPQHSAGTQTATVTQSQSTSPPATTTVVVAGPDCGNGTATASVASQTFPRNQTSNTDYETDATASVRNGVDKPIQIDALTIRLVYEDGGQQDVVFNNAVGNVVQPGVTNTYKVALNTGQRQLRPDGVAMQSFSFHTQGHPECSGRPA
jgi:hypothetical protein